MKKAVWVLVALVAGLAVLQVLKMVRTGSGPAESAATSVPAAPAVPPALGAPAPPRHPIEEVRAPAPVPEPLPPLAASDGPIRSALAALIGRPELLKLVHPERFVRNVVVTIDNLPRSHLSAIWSPIERAPGKLGTVPNGTGTVLASENVRRYAGYLRLLEALDTAQLVDFYVRFYPLFQQAYRELGYPNGHFNDRVVEAIDNLLATPDLAGRTIELESKVVYAPVEPQRAWAFADPDLERRSAGQKILMRIGPEAAGLVKSRLGEIRAALAPRG